MTLEPLTCWDISSTLVLVPKAQDRSQEIWVQILVLPQTSWGTSGKSLHPIMTLLPIGKMGIIILITSVCCGAKFINEMSVMLLGICR